MADSKDSDIHAPTVSPLGVRRWSTEGVPQAQKLDYWLGAVCEGFEELEVSIPDVSKFGASIDSAHCGHVVVNRVQGTPQDVRRTKKGISHSAGSCFYLMCTLDAPWLAGQKGDVTRLLPGDCMLLSSDSPYEMHFQGPASLVNLVLPVNFVESWLTDPAAHCGVRMGAENGWGQTLSSFVRQLTPQMAGAPPLPASLMTDQLGSLLSLGASGFAGNGKESISSLDAFMAKATENLKQRYAEFGLTAQAVAHDLNVSERTLHRNFSRSGATFLQHLMNQRMVVAETMLRDPRFDRLTVSEIGRRVGLTDVSHFIRQCRAQRGMTPASIRRLR